MVRLGLALPSRPASWDRLVDLAREAEAAGWASVWLPDPPPGPAPGDHLDPVVALAGLARATSRIRVGTLLDAGRRPPGVLAKSLATLDQLSGGRLTVGLMPPADDGEGAQELAEVLEVLRAAFGGATVHHAGRSHRIEGLRVDPGPVQPRPPLWVVGRSAPVLAVAAGMADGWSPGRWAGGPAGFRADAGRLDDACRGAGRSPATLARSANWLAGRGPGDRRAVLRAWAAAGVADLLVSPGALPFGETSTDSLQKVASATE